MWDFPFSNPFRFYWCFYLCSEKSTDSSTLKHHNFFQHYNKRKGTHTFVFRLLIFRIFSNKKFLNPVTSASVRDVEKLLWFFQKFIFQRKVKSWFFVTFNVFLSHIFPENFIEFSSSPSEDMKTFLLFIINFQNMKGGSNWSLPRKKLPLKSLALLGLMYVN